LDVTNWEEAANMNDVRALLAANMKRFREALSLSQMELAEKIGCSPTTIGKIETMKRFPSADNLNRLADAFKIAPSALFLDTDTSRAANSVASQQKRKFQLQSELCRVIDDFFSAAD